MRSIKEIQQSFLHHEKPISDFLREDSLLVTGRTSLAGVFTVSSASDNCPVRIQDLPHSLSESRCILHSSMSAFDQTTFCTLIHCRIDL